MDDAEGTVESSGGEPVPFPKPVDPNRLPDEFRGSGSIPGSHRGPREGDSAASNINRVVMAGEMIGFSHVDSAGTQRITLVDTGKSWMAVYHIDKSGVIRLISSRPIDADFSLQLNATSPLPEEIRQMAGPSR